MPTIRANLGATKFEAYFDDSTQFATVYASTLTDTRPVATLQRRRVYSRGPIWRIYLTDGSEVGQGFMLVSLAMRAMVRELKARDDAAEAEAEAVRDALDAGAAKGVADAEAAPPPFVCSNGFTVQRDSAGRGFTFKAPNGTFESDPFHTEVEAVEAAMRATMATRQDAARQEGARALRDGKPPRANPYHFGRELPLFAAWEAGYFTAAAHVAAKGGR